MWKWVKRLPIAVVAVVGVVSLAFYWAFNNQTQIAGFTLSPAPTAEAQGQFVDLKGSNDTSVTASN